MLQTAERSAATSSKALPHPRYLEAFRWMLQTRVFEEKLTSLYRGGQITGGVYIGREADKHGECERRAAGGPIRHADDPAARRQLGQRQSSLARSGIGMRTASSMHQQAPLAPPVPQSNAAPHRAQARRRNGNLV